MKYQVQIKEMNVPLTKAILEGKDITALNALYNAKYLEATNVIMYRYSPIKAKLIEDILELQSTIDE